MNKTKRTIAGIRKDLGLTQYEMAAKLNIPIATFQRYERCETPIPVKVAIEIADLVNVEDLREIKLY